AEVAFNAPHRNHGRRVDAVRRFHPGQHIRMALQHLPAVGDTLLVDQAGEVVPDRRLELGLRIQQPQHRGVRHHRAHVPVEQRAADAFAPRPRLQTVHAAAVSGLVVCGRRRRRRLRRRGHGEDEQVRKHGRTISTPVVMGPWSARQCHVTARTSRYPPTLSHRKSTPASNSGRGPSARSLAMRVSAPSAAMAVASNSVSNVSSAALHGPGSWMTELRATTARTPNANHGITMARSPPSRASCQPSTSNTGTSSNTRVSLTMTAASAVSGLTALPTATTCATSCTVAPAYSPNAAGSSPRCGYSIGYRKMLKVPHNTTVATAIATLLGSARSTRSTASTAAAPQIALPAAVSIAVCRSRPNQRRPAQVPSMSVDTTTTTSTSSPAAPIAAMSWKLSLSPYRTTPARTSCRCDT